MTVLRTRCRRRRQRLHRPLFDALVVAVVGRARESLHGCSPMMEAGMHLCVYVREPESIVKVRFVYVCQCGNKNRI